MHREKLIMVCTCEIAGRVRGKGFPARDLASRMTKGVGWVPTNTMISAFSPIYATTFGTGGDLGSDEEQDFLGLPGLLDPDQVTTLLRQRQADQLSGRRSAKASKDAQLARLAEMDHRKQAALRKELSQLVGAWARRSGQPHGTVHSELRRRCGGPEVALADPDQLAARLELLRGWFVGKR